VTREEAILFAAELGAKERIVHYLIELSSQGLNISEEILSKLDATETRVHHFLKLYNQGVTIPEDSLLTAVRASNFPPIELIEAVVNDLKRELGSPIETLVFSVAETLITLALKASEAPKLIVNAAQPYLKHHQSWTRLAALTISLASGNESIDVYELELQIDNILSEEEENRQKRQFKIETIRNGIPRLYPLRGRHQKISWLKSIALFEGLKFLLKRNLNNSTVQWIKLVITQSLLIDSPSVGEIFHQVFQGKLLQGNERLYRSEESLKRIIREELMIRGYENQTKEEIEACQMLKNLLRDSDEKISNVERSIFSSNLLESEVEQLWKKLRYKQDTKSANQVFLESISRVVTYSPTSLLLKPQNFPLLGVLIQGMGCLGFPSYEWDAIGECQELASVDVVVKGAIAAMNLEHQELAIEAQLLLEQILTDKDLDKIEAELNGVNIYRVRKRLLETEFGIFSRVPKVPAHPQWERVKEIDISTQELKKALDHPSAIIHAHAALILIQKIGKEETVPILKSKGWDSKRVDSFLAKQEIAET
jgi:hypothetical protein